MYTLQKHKNNNKNKNTKESLFNRNYPKGK